MSITKVFSFLVFLFFLAYSGSSHADISKAREVIVGAIDQVYTDLDGEYADSERLQEAAEEVIRDKVLPLLNIRMFSKLILASHWKKISNDQRAKFNEVLTGFLVRSFAKAIAADKEQFDGYSDNMAIEPAKPGRNENRAVVPMLVKSGNATITIEFRMARNDDLWQLYDVVFEGVSFALNYRTILKSEIGKHGIDAVTANLEAKLIG